MYTMYNIIYMLYIYMYILYIIYIYIYIYIYYIYIREIDSQAVKETYIISLYILGNL